jgi:hypothetical protein
VPKDKVQETRSQKVKKRQRKKEKFNQKKEKVNTKPKDKKNLPKILAESQPFKRPALKVGGS